MCLISSFVLYKETTRGLFPWAITKQIKLGHGDLPQFMEIHLEDKFGYKVE